MSSPLLIAHVDQRIESACRDLRATLELDQTAFDQSGNSLLFGDEAADVAEAALLAGRVQQALRKRTGIKT